MRKVDAVIAQQDAVILGQCRNEEWAAFWPTSDIEPFATFINGVAEYVGRGVTTSSGHLLVDHRVTG